MAESSKLTKRAVDAKKPTDKTRSYWDPETRGFGLRVTSNGVKTYVLRYRTEDGRDRTLTLGRHGPLTPDTARAKAVAALASVIDGEDPAPQPLARLH